VKRFTIGERLRKLFQGGADEERFLNGIEDLLVEADIGAVLAGSLVAELKKTMKTKGLRTEEDFITELKTLLGLYLATIEIIPAKDVMNIFLVCGVNGVGKTTTIGKLAYYFMHQCGCANVLLSAADTFRAAAIEQLLLIGERLGLPVIHQTIGSDPGAVVFDTMESAKARRAEIVIIDTSGRMHTKEHLVKELAKIDKIVAGKINPGSFYHKVLVIDTTTGQNALRQAEVFNEALGIDSIVLAKYDSSAKGGIAVAIGRELKIPFSFIGSGEKFENLKPFNKEEFILSLFEDL
jgi:fused signal recognition particle receptor